MLEWNKKEAPLKALAGMGGGVGRGGSDGSIKTNDSDPFGDSSCLYTYQLNGNSQKLGGGTALSGDTGQITANAAKFGSHGFNGTGSSRLYLNDTFLRPSTTSALILV